MPGACLLLLRNEIIEKIALGGGHLVGRNKTRGIGSPDHGSAPPSARGGLLVSGDEPISGRRLPSRSLR